MDQVYTADRNNLAFDQLIFFLDFVLSYAKLRYLVAPKLPNFMRVLFEIRFHTLKPTRYITVLRVNTKKASS